MSSKVETPFPIFTDIDGSPLEDGYIYVGTAGLDPSTNGITVYSDADLSTVVAQPIRTKSGFPVVSGSPIRIYTGVGNFSLRVANKNNSQVLQDLNAGASVNIGVSLPDGSAAAPSLSNTGDSNTGLYYPSADQLAIATGGVQRVVVDDSGNLGVGTSSPSSVISGSSTTLEISDGNVASIRLSQTANKSFEIASTNSNALVFYDADSVAERMVLDAPGNLLVGKTASNYTTVGVEVKSNGEIWGTVTGRNVLLNRLGSDGELIGFAQDGVVEGSVSVSGTTVSYNGGHLARWSRMLDGSKPENLLKGTVMTNLDEMIEWAYPETPEVLWAAGDGLPEGVSVGDVKVEGVAEVIDEEGNIVTEAVEEVLWGETDGLPEGVSIGDVKVEYKPAGVEDNEQLNHTAISSVEGDKDVAGVFIAWDDDDEYNDYHLAMAGDVIIRIAEGVEVKRGDLLVSAGDGTAKPQDDDIIRSSTVAKVTSTVVSCTYDDGSFCVPCVLK